MPVLNPWCNKSLSIYKQNIDFLSWTVAEKSITKIAVLITWREKKITNIRKNKQGKAGYLPHITTCCCYSVYQIWTLYLI